MRGGRWGWTCLGWLVAGPVLALEPTAAPLAGDATGATADRAPVLAVPPAVAFKQDKPVATENVGWHAWLFDRLATQRQTTAPVQGPLASDVGLGPHEATWNRLRVGTSWNRAAHSGFVREFQAVLEGDVDRGTLDRFDRPAGTYTLRKAFVEATTLAGQFGAGRMVASWGLGLVAQAGEDDPLQFGMRRGGTLVDRAQYAVLPAALINSGNPLGAFPLAVAVAYDRLISDDLVRQHDRWDGVTGSTDVGRNLVAALLYRGKDLQFGAYLTGRHQTDAQGLGIDARIVDGFWRWQFHHLGWKFCVAGEAVYASGTTTWLRTPAQPNLLDIEQFGGAVRLEANHGTVHARLEGGIASGDSRPFDGTVRNFAFASDYRVGLVLFPAYLSAISAMTRSNLGDPRFVAQSPAGADHVLTHGAVTQAIYLHPVVRIQATRRIAVLGGLVWARAPVDVAEPYRTFLNGGTPTGARGAKSRRDLGVEFDGAVEVAQPLGSESVQLLARADAGVLLPGDAFDDADGHSAGAIAVVQGQMAIRARW